MRSMPIMKNTDGRSSSRAYCNTCNATLYGIMPCQQCACPKTNENFPGEACPAWVQGSWCNCTGRQGDEDRPIVIDG